MILKVILIEIYTECNKIQEKEMINISKNKNI